MAPSSPAPPLPGSRPAASQPARPPDPSASIGTPSVLWRRPLPLWVLLPLAALLLTNVLRVYFPGLATDALFGLALLGLGLSLLREPGPWPRAVLFCFAALAALYALGLAIEFSAEGGRNLAAVLCAAAIFLFGFRNAAALTGHRALVAMLPVAMAALLVLYLTPVSLDPHTLSAFFGYSLLIIGLLLAVGRRQRWAQVAFPLAIVVGMAFGNRSLAVAALAGYGAYWAGKTMLRSRLRAMGMAAGLGLLICSLVALLVGLRATDALAELDRLSRESVGGRIQSGRQVLWHLALNRIAAAPWLGHGPGAHVTFSAPSPGVPSQGPADARQAAALPCLEQDSPGLAADCALLLEVRHILVGPGGARRMLWNWNLRTPLSRWRGVVLGGEPPRIVELRLRRSRLQGSIPPQLGDLDGLRVLNLSNNQLTGGIPPELGRLRSLQVLALHGNRLNGPIPSELARLPGLRDVRLGGGNAISGCVSRQLREGREALAASLGLPICGTLAADAPRAEADSIGAMIAKVDGWIPSLRSVPKVSRSAHNLFLQVGMQTGIPGMAVLALLCTSLILGLVVPGGGATEPKRCFALAAVVTVIVHSAFEVFLLQDNIVVAAIAWLLIGLAIGAPQVRQNAAEGVAP